MRIQHFSLLVIVVLAALLRLYHLGYSALWYDEIGQVLVAQNNWWGTIAESAAHAGSAPLDYLITYATLKIGSGDALLRLPAVLFGVLAVVLAGYWGARLVGWPAALLVAFALAIMPMHIAYSREVRFYSVATFLMLLSAAVFWHAQNRNTWRSWIAFGVTLTVTLYAHYYGVFLAGALFLWLCLFRRAALLRFVVVSLAAALLFAPWVYYDNVVQGSPGSFANAQLRLYGGVPKLLTAPFISLPTSLRDLSGVPRATFGFAYAVWALFAATLLWLPWARRRNVLVLCLLVVTSGFAGLLALDWYGGYVFNNRQTLMFLPFLLLGAAGVLFDVTQRIRVRWLAPALAMALIIPMTLVLWPHVADAYPATRANALADIGSYFHRHMQSDDIVISAYPDHAGYYAPLLKPYLRRANLGKMDETFAALAEKHGRVWILAWGPNWSAPLAQWGKANGAWDVSPWGTQFYLYAPTDPDAGLRIAQSILADPLLTNDKKRAMAGKIGIGFIARERVKEAIPYLERAVNASDPDLSLVIALAEAYMRLPDRTRWADAQPLWEHVLEIHPTHYNARLNLARILARQEGWSRVQSLLQTIPDEPASEYVQAQSIRLLFAAYAATEQNETRCALWDVVIERAPHSAFYQRIVRDYPGMVDACGTGA